MVVVADGVPNMESWPAGVAGAAFFCLAFLPRSNSSNEELPNIGFGAATLALDSITSSFANVSTSV